MARQKVVYNLLRSRRGTRIVHRNVLERAVSCITDIPAQIKTLPLIWITEASSRCRKKDCHGAPHFRRVADDNDPPPALVQKRTGSSEDAPLDRIGPRRLTAGYGLDGTSKSCGGYRVPGQSFGYSVHGRDNNAGCSENQCCCPGILCCPGFPPGQFLYENRLICNDQFPDQRKLILCFYMEYVFALAVKFNTDHSVLGRAYRALVDALCGTLRGNTPLSTLLFKRSDP